jgi:two-component system, chemotaxis family, sensor kinase CheA
MEMSEYMGLFLDESHESLQSLNASLLELERDPSDPDPLVVIFRVAHSLKGMSATMGFDRMAGLTHRMEEVLTVLRDGGAAVTTDVVDVLFACLDTLGTMVDGIAAGSDGAVDTAGLLTRLERVGSGAPAPSPAAAAPPARSAEPTGDLSHYEQVVVREAGARGLAVHRLDVELAEGCMLRAARAYMVVQALEPLGDLIKSEPDVAALEAEELGGGFTLWLAGPEETATIEAAVTGVSEVTACRVTVVSAGDADAPGEPPAAAEGGSAAEVPGAPSEGLGTPREEHGDVPATGAPVAPATRRRAAAPTVRVGTDRLDSLMNLMGEMVIQRTRLQQLAGDHGLPDLRAAVEDLGRVTNDLQTLVMQVRMMPVEAVFMRFPRMVRDLAVSLGKNVELIVAGEDTELDRTVIDELGDPLVHMLRNAVDHGLETPEERTAAGKDPVGRVWLTARHAGNHVEIEVREDGRGIDPARLRDAVVAKGLMSRGDADALSDGEAVELIFLPGFSTARTTTDVSGRGVGMDAVRAKISGLNGDVRISSVPGEGTRFTIRLPLTLAIIQALLVRSAGETYALPLEAIDETVVIGRGETRPVNGRDCMVLRDRIVPLISLRERLSLERTDAGAPTVEVVVVRVGAAHIGVVVDALIGQREIVIKHLPAFLGDVLGIAGATILGDGSVALIVDVSALGGQTAAARA